jgi:hypothetical protein
MRVLSAYDSGAARLSAPIDGVVNTPEGPVAILQPVAGS